MSILTRRIIQLSKRSIQQTETIYHLSSSTSYYRQLSGFSYVGPRKLDEVMRVELLQDKKKAEVSDIWMTYHEDKERVHGAFLSGEEGIRILERAEKS